MVILIKVVVLASLLLTVSSLPLPSTTAPTWYCVSHPLPSVSPNVLLNHLQNYLTTMESKIQAALTAEKAPGGVAVGLVYRDQLLWFKGFGYVDIQDPARAPPNANTGFRIGSITKVLTSLLTLILRDEGSLRSLDDNVTEYLPEFRIKNPFQTKRGVTFKQLMSHMSGLPRAVPCEDMFSTGCSLSDEDIYKNLAEIELLYPPGDRPLYSNLGFGLLGRALEKVTKEKWEKSVEEMVFETLGMTTSGNTFTAADIQKLAIGYYKGNIQAGFVDIGWDAPAGQSYSSVADLAQLMMLIFREDQSAGATKNQILDGETIREWLNPAYMYPDTTGFSYPWELLPLGNYTLKTKDGRINGYQSEFYMATEIKTGFVFLQSCDNCESHYDITGILEGLILEVDRVLSQLQTPPTLPANITVTQYTGRFSATIEGVKNTRTISVGKLYGGPVLIMESGGPSDPPMYLYWVTGDSFQVSVQGFKDGFNCYGLHGGHIGQRVYFHRDSLGEVGSLTLPGTVYGKVFLRER